MLSLAPDDGLSRRYIVRLLWALLLAAFALTWPALAVRLSNAHLASPPTEAVVFGLAILGAAFLLAWAAEVAQLEISQSLALAILALIAVLPEYAVDLYFAWTAASNPDYIGYATANMTGANRLLVGFAWPLVIFIAWLRSRRPVVQVDTTQRTAVVFLGLATVYSFLLPLKGSISLVDGFVLVSLFALYSWRLAGQPTEEPELVGPPRLVAALPRTPRRVVTVLLFLYAAILIYLSAEPFADALVHSGSALGIDEFVLVQWLAPLASEAPEILVACLFALRLHASAGLGTLVSSKVNQWTLLVGTLPAAFSIASGRVMALPLDQRQADELFLTAAQSLFATVLLLDLRIGLVGAATLLGLFLTQLVAHQLLMPVAFTYLLLSAWLAFRSRDTLLPTLRAGLFAAPANRPPAPLPK